MAKKPTPGKPAKPAESREDRLKMALKANLARRKAQARSRAATGADKTGRHED